MKESVDKLKGETDPEGQWETSALLSQPQTGRGDRKSARGLDEMSNTMSHLDVIGIYGTLHPTTAEHTRAHETFTKKDPT